MIKIKDLVHKYDVWESDTEKTKKTVLDGVNLDVRRGSLSPYWGRMDQGNLRWQSI